MSSTPSSWAQLRQQTRQNETQTQKAFQIFSQFPTSPNLPSKPSDEETRAEAQISTLLSERESLINQLSRSHNSDAHPSALKTSHLQRHREILQESRQEFSRIKSQISQARDRGNLLSSVREDIAAYRAANPGDAEAEYMLQERSRLDSSHAMADNVLSQAYAVNESFGLQREQLERVRMRITNAVGMVPGVNGLIGRIGMKRRRDGIILGSFIAFCFLAFLYFL